MADSTLFCPRCGKAFAIRHRQAGQRYLCPHCRQPFSLQPAGEPASPPAEKPKPAAPAPSALIPESLPGGPAGIGPRRRKKNVIRLFGPAGILVAIVCVAVLFAWDRYERRSEQATANAAKGPTHTQGTREPTPKLVAAPERKPIEMLLVPAGTRIVIHLRPARLWTAMHFESGKATDRQASTWRAYELQLCLPGLAAWAREQIENWCLFPPDQIDEADFAIALRSPGDPPDVSVLVRLAESAGHAVVEKRFGGAPSGRGSVPTFVKGDRALVVRDAQTFAVGPAESAQEMADAHDRPNPTDPGIEELLKVTDRSRDLSIVFRPDDLDRFRDSLVSPQWASDLHQLATWLDPEAAEAAVFSMRLDDPLRLRLTTRTRPVVYAPRFAETVKERLDRLPTDLLKYVQSLQPTIPGSRKLIGRLPAMSKAVALGTSVTSQPRLVTLESILPERAAPNLSLATYLLLTEGPTSASRSPAAPVTARRESSKSLLARLQTPIDVDFKRTPLSEAFEAIGSDVEVTFELDGGAMKLAGYTKNMPQTFQLKGAPAAESLRTILKAYPKLALVGDETRRTIVVTTTDAATAQHKTPMALGK